MSPVRLTLLLCLLPVPLLAEPPVRAPNEGAADAQLVPVVRLAPEATGPAPRALRYNLLPLRGDLQPGNAALLWIRAGQAAREVSKKINDKWAGSTVTALKDLPKMEVREVLKGYAATLRLAEQAAHRERCDWEVPPFTLDNWDFPFTEIQDCRLLAQVLSVRCRLELSEGDFDNAAKTLRTGLVLARHLGDSDTLIQGLVGIAIAQVMFGHIEEWMQVPGSPNLYWSLTALPVPFIDVRRAIEFEFSNLDHAFPQMRQARNATTAPAQVEALVAEISAFFARIQTYPPSPEWQIRLGMACLAAKYYPDARRRLLAAGYKAERLDAMSPVQVILVQFFDQNDQFRDEVLKVLALPPWQARAAMEQVATDIQKLRQKFENPFLTLLFPAVSKVYEARVRVERTVASLRSGEALRLYAAAHDGKAPSKFTDVTTVPLPVDPLTGKGFDGFYTQQDGRGVLDVPSLNPATPQLGRRFEIGPPR